MLRSDEEKAMPTLVTGIGLSFGYHLVDEWGFVNIDVAVLTEAQETLYSHRVFSLYCHEIPCFEVSAANLVIIFH